MTDALVADALADQPEGTAASSTGSGPRWLGAAGWYPLTILFGLNMADELDRAAYLILLPEIRDHFGLSNSGILSVVALASAVALLLTVPTAHLADRSSRVRIALLGAALWAAFSFGTGWRSPCGCCCSCAPVRPSVRPWSSPPTTACWPTTTRSPVGRGSIRSIGRPTASAPCWAC